MDFVDKVVVITGGSKGFGEALARAFTKENARVIISSHDESELSATAEKLGVDPHAADVSSYEEVRALADHVTKKYGRLDVWINNAGIQIAPSSIESVRVDKLRELFEVNFFGYFYGCMVALKTMKHQNHGLIINVNSTAGLSGKPGLSAYVSSKFAIKGLSESIREELKGSDIRLYQIFPGGMQTDIYHEKVPADFGDYMPVDYAVEKVMQNFKLPEPEQDLIIKRPTKAA